MGPGCGGLGYVVVVDLMPGTEPARALEALQTLRTALANTAGYGHAGRDHYVITLETVDAHFRTLWASDEWMRRVYSDRYWRIREATPQTYRYSSLIEGEVAVLLAWFDRLIAEIAGLKARDDAAD